MISRTCIAPIERVKIMYQVSRGTEHSGGYLRMLPSIAKNEGLCTCAEAGRGC